MKTNRLIGTVKQWDGACGIIDHYGDDVRIHWTKVKDYNQIEVGTQVEFDTEPIPDGRQAVNVVILKQPERSENNE